MYIHEAVLKAKSYPHNIYRNVWIVNGVVSKLVLPVWENGTCLLRASYQGETILTEWHPTLQDLSADDWQLICRCPHEKKRGFLGKLLGW